MGREKDGIAGKENPGIGIESAGSLIFREISNPRSGSSMVGIFGKVMVGIFGRENPGKGILSLGRVIDKSISGIFGSLIDGMPGSENPGMGIFSPGSEKSKLQRLIQ